MRSHDVSRRAFLQGAGLGGLATAVGVASTSRLAAALPSVQLVRRPGAVGAAPAQLHVQFGSDASRQVAVSWAAPERVGQPRLRLGTPNDGFGHVVQAEERVYTEALTGQTVWTYHARLDGLDADADYRYDVSHDGTRPVAGRFRTGPRGRSQAFRFTSFGDQSIPAPVGQGLGPNSPNAGYVVDAVESTRPLFHLLNGDLCYANVSDAPVETWAGFFANIERSAANRPWMPAAGNHENEVGNGPQGYLGYQTRFTLPDNGSPPPFQGNWYAFRVGSALVISINNDDFCLQDGGFSTYRRDHLPGYASNGENPYIRGYSDGAQLAWLERTLRAARTEEDIDWIIVCMHQVAMSSAHFNGADLGIRRQLLPLFDAYGVDLVIAGHEHHFERTFPVWGSLAGGLLTPAAQGSDADLIDTTEGAVHMIIGGGGHPGFTSPQAFDSPHDGVVIYDVGPGDPTTQHKALTTTEPAGWSAYRDLTTPYGFAAFDLDPLAAGGKTTITVTHYGAQKGSPAYVPIDRFVLTRPRRGAHRHEDDALIGESPGRGVVVASKR